MGLFDKFKKKNEEKEEVVNIQQNTRQDRVAITGNPESSILIDYYDSQAPFKQFYDSTCLYVYDTNPVYTGNGENVYNALVSWYGENDCEYSDDNGVGHNIRREDTHQIQLGLDLYKLSDPEYLRYLITKLLEEKRVKRYLDMGLEENPQNPCGNYIGEVYFNEEKASYGKKFRKDIGLKSHYAPTQVKRRMEHRAEIEEMKTRRIQENREKIARLQDEIDSLSR